MISGADMAVAPEKIVEITRWCIEISEGMVQTENATTPGNNAAISGLTFHINPLSPEDLKMYLPEIRHVSTIARLILHYGDTEEVSVKALRW